MSTKRFAGRRPDQPRADALAERLADLAGLRDRLAASLPALEGGQVRCVSCGAVEVVDAAECLRNGWPSCCGATMRLVTA